MAHEGANNPVKHSVAEENPDSVQATIESGIDFGATESTCNDDSVNAAETSAVTSDCELEKSLEYADELILRGAKAAKERDYTEATDCYSRALEIRVAHFGELSPECASAYYKYGCSLLYKAQEDADPLGSMPKKEGASHDDSNVNGTIKNPVNAESAASDSNGEVGSIDFIDDAADEVEEESDAEDLPHGDEDESDLDLAWKMLDVARAINEKHSGDTMEKVDILSALAEVSLEREDIETSLNDYLQALSMLERLVEHDNRFIAELNFRVCLCLEIGSRPDEAIPYCQKAISVCKARLQRLMNEVKTLPEASKTTTDSESSQSVQQSSTTSDLGDSIMEKDAEIETLTGLCDELEKKLEDLQLLVSNPRSILSDILSMISAKDKGAKKDDATTSTSSIQTTTVNTGVITDSPTVSTVHVSNTSSVTHLGVVGRGVKRVVISSTSESVQTKKPSLDPSSNGRDSGTS